MPQVGGKHYSYSPAGVAAAKKEATRTGTPMTKKRKSSSGGISSAMKGAAYGTSS